MKNMIKTLSAGLLATVSATAFSHSGHHDQFHAASMLQGIQQWLQHMLHSDFHLSELLVMFFFITAISAVVGRSHIIKRKQQASKISS